MSKKAKTPERVIMSKKKKAPELVVIKYEAKKNKMRCKYKNTPNIHG